MDHQSVGLSGATPIRQVLVPRTPGALRTMDQGSARPPDELDAVIEDVFGEAVDERSGWIDAVLVIAGLGLVAWGVVGGSTLSGMIGVGCLLLGLALPARDAFRLMRARRAAASRTRLASQGTLLDVSHPATTELAEAYGRLVDAAEAPGAAVAGEALSAGHLAVEEVASLLHGAPPSAPAEVGYIGRRTRAVTALADELIATSARWEADRQAEREGLRREDELHLQAVTTAREELDSIGGLGSLDRLDALTDQLRRGRTDDAA